MKIMKIFSKPRLKLLLINSIVGTFSSLCILPLLIRIQFIQKILSIQTYNILIYIIPFFLFIFITTNNHINSFWKRIRNNYELDSPPYTIFEHFLYSIIFFGLVTILFHKKLFYATYISTEFFNVLAISFVLFLLCFLIPLFSNFSLFSYKSRKESIEETKAIPFFADEPINNLDQDLLGRKDFVKNLALQVKKIPFPDSYVIGLYAKWGEGKTSVLKLVKTELLKDKKDGVIFIEFDPWIFKDDETILRGFYNSIFSEINKEYFLPDLKRLLKKYINLLNYEAKHLPFNINLTEKEDRIEEVKEKVDSCIKKLGRKIIISIDDIDRLIPEEVLLIYKIVKTSANFKNTIFILAFDPKEVIEALQNKLKIGDEFLEKIIQQPIYLPEIEQDDVDDFLGCALEKLMEEVDIKKDRLEKFAQDFRVEYLTNINKLFRTLRQAKRYLNGIRSSLPAVINEVNLFDFFVLEIIKMFFPVIYDDIYENWWFYVNSRSENDPIFLSPLAHLEEEKANEKIKEHWIKVANEYKDKYKKEVLEIIICQLFRKINQALERNLYNSDNPELDQKIDSSAFIKYFINRIPRREISDEIVIKNIEIWNKEEKEQVIEIIKKTIVDFTNRGDLIKLFEKLIKFSEKIKPEKAEIIIECMAQKAKAFSQSHRHGSRESELNRAEYLILKILDERIRKQKIQHVIEHVIENSTAIMLPIRLTVDCDKARLSGFYRLRENIDLARLRKLTLNKLEKFFIEEEHDIFKTEITWSEIIGVWASNYDSGDEKTKKIVNDYLFSLVDTNPKYLGLIMKTWSKGPDQRTINLDEMTKYFDLDGLYKRILKFKGKAYSNEEEKKALDTFKKAYEER